MSIQIAVRVPDDLVAFVDETVKVEGASGRAAIVTRALERERRRLAAERDAEIYARLAAGRDADDLDELTGWAAAQPMDID
jgi:metal-responsive CopG/Arc/MetJ family transcriptional regulator